MPVIQRRIIFFEGQRLEQVVKVSAAGEFSSALPVPVSQMFGFAIVTGKTKDECLKLFDQKMAEYKASRSTDKRVILYKVYDRISFADGIALAIAAQEYTETKTVTADGKELFKYQPLDYQEKTLDSDLHPRSSWSLHSSTREEHGSKIDWTPERAEFLNKIAKALTKIKAELQKLDDPTDMIRIADNGLFLEDKKPRRKR